MTWRYPFKLTIAVLLCLVACSPAATDTPSLQPPLAPTTPPTQIFTSTATPSATNTIQPTAISPASATPGLDGTPLSPGFEPVSSNNDWTPYIEEFDGLEMALVPAGCFEMGSTDEQVDDVMRQCEEVRGAGNCTRSWYLDEQPVNTQCFDEAFWIDVYEVTNAQYGSSGKWAGDELPRENVSWADAAIYCKSRGARLPTEAEWEYAARGPDGLAFPWGDVFKRRLVNSCDKSCVFNLIGTRVDDGYEHTAPVGSFVDGASWVGAMDMSGNVWEWTSSIIMNYPYDATDGREADGSIDSSSRRVMRGGSWFHSGSDILRSATRYEVSPDYSDYVVGFRCVNSATDTPHALTATETATPQHTTHRPTEIPLPVFSGDGQIVFISTRDGNMDLFSQNLSDGKVRRLTTNQGDNVWPDWSPNGDQIAFESTRDGNYEIYTMNADGSNVQRLTDNTVDDMDPTWSPDGTRLAFNRMQDENIDIFVIDKDGDKSRQLTDHPAFDYTPAWSPDGSRIAFCSHRDGNGEIYLMNPDGSGLTRLTDSESEDYMPAWSPDGTQITFTSERDGNWEVYVMDADGGNQHRLMENSGNDSFSTWSPDGNWIAFSMRQGRYFNLYVIPANGGEIQHITDSEADDWGIDWINTFSPTATQLSRRPIPTLQSPPDGQYGEQTAIFQYDNQKKFTLVYDDLKQDGNIDIHEIRYMQSSTVTPAYLVLPPGEGPYPAIIYLHAGMARKDQFLDEAILLAKSGVVSLLIDGPLSTNRVDSILTPEAIRIAYINTVIELRRGIDLLQSLLSVDPERIAYVGHSYGATWGGPLAGVETRLKAYVLMAGYAQVSENDTPTVPDLDAIHFVGHSSPAAILLQFAENDIYIDQQEAQLYFNMAGQPKEMIWYQTDHWGLQDVGQEDRLLWLGAQLGFEYP